MVVKYFPKISSNLPTNTVREGEHIDCSGITILFAEEEGLEILQEDKWLPVPVKHNSFIINIGEQLQRLSNGKLRASMHRVSTSGEMQDRISIAFFSNEICSLKKDKLINPLIISGEKINYTPFSVRDFMESHYNLVG